MAKKNNNPVYFNLFEAEQFSEDEEQNLTEDITESVEEKSNYVSIVQIEASEDIEVSEPDAAQTTMFEDKNFNNFFFNENTEENEVKDESPSGEETFSDEQTPQIQECVIEEIAINENEEVAENELTETVSAAMNVDVTESTTDESIIPQSDEEDAPVSTLEKAHLDEEYSEELSHENKETIFENLLTYDEIKNKDTSDTFETPYLFHGKSGDRIRYRLDVPSQNKPKSNRFKKSAMSWFLTILVAFVLAMFLRTFVFVIATVDGPSMLPTLENNEKLFVTKYTYAFSEVQRGDVVICKYGSEIYPDNYVKRVIGLSGEMISISDGFVYINGTKLEEDYIFEPMSSDMEPVYIPEDCVFVMGDNRNNSADSRKSIVGPIKKDLIIGKAQFIIAPINKIGSLGAEK